MKYFVIFIALILCGCKKNREPNLLIMIDNSLQHSPKTNIRIKVNNQMVYNGFLKRAEHSDQYYFYKDYLEPGPNSISILVPEHKILENFDFDLKTKVAIGVHLESWPIYKKEIIDSDSALYELSRPKILIQKYKTDNIGQYDSLEHILLKKQI